MIGRFWRRANQALSHAAHSGFPWVGAVAPGGLSRPLCRAIRRSVIAHWPAAVRPLGAVLMTLLWPLASLYDALVFPFQLDRRAFGGRSRLSVGLRAWGAALAYNMPPLDYLCYRLFEPGRPGPGHWLHSADSHLHFRAIAAPEVQALAADKLAFADLGQSLGAPVMPVLAAYRAGGALRPFGDGAPPAQDLLVKPRRGWGRVGQVSWRWNGERHVADPPVPEPDLDSWLARASRSGHLLVQPLAGPPDRLGPFAPILAPELSLYSAEWPDGRRAIAFAFLSLAIREAGAEVWVRRAVDPATGTVLPAQPGQVDPVWPGLPDLRAHEPFAIPGWSGLLAEVDQFHAALPGPAPVLKWDFILTDQGPRLLETNTGTNVYVIQLLTLRPITETAIGDALEAWAR